MKARDFIKLLPTNEEVKKWYDENVDTNECSASSVIYKFRIFLKENIEEKCNPKRHNLNGFTYIEEK